MRAPPGLTSGRFAGRYTIERLIGEGATATVHLARDPERGIAVAIKILRPELVDSAATARFLKEIRRTSRLQHPHILPVLDSDEYEGQPYFVLPYMEGGTLRLRLKREHQLELTEALAIVQTIGEALDYAHAHGLIHRDVKPENILFTSGQAVLSDFGIAHALEVLSGEASTSSGVIRGTPAYMSPEQAAGSKDCDGRSDIYSLGCVFYEMVTGMQAFIGPTPQSVIAQRFAFPPREVRVYRPTAPPALDAVLAKAFALTPADRYQTAAELVAALKAVLTPAVSSTPSSVLPAVARWRSRMVSTAVGTGALIASLIATWVSLQDPPLDVALYVVAPFSVSGRPAKPTLDGASAATLAYDALRRWPDLLRVDPLRVNDLVSRRGGPPTSLAEALELARSVRAARLVWGDMHERAGTTVVRGVLYDVANPRVPPREASVTLRGANDDSLSLRFAALVDSLVAGAQPRPRAGSTKPFGAVTAYAAGVSALTGWDLRAARRHFRAALETEPNYPAASLRLAQVSQWLRAPTSEWRSAAAAAGVGSGTDLSPRERLHASALLAMADADYPRACQHYAQLAASDSLDFATWFGLGECRLQDRLVVRDSSSPSGWRFRSSRHAAAQAYARAFEIVPTSYQAYRDMIAYRFDKAFITRPGHFRDGVAADPTAPVFGAFPELVADTIAFVPYPYAEYTAGTRRPRAAAVSAALEAARRRIAVLSDRWVKISPESQDAWEVRALALERAGVIVGHRDRSAIGSIGRARRLATERLDSVRLATTEVRLRLKAGQFRAAAQLADSLTRHWTDPEPEIAGSLARLAGLLGRLGEMEQLLDRFAPVDSSFISLDGRNVRPPPLLAALAMRLAANSALGGRRDTIEALERRIEQHLASIPHVADRNLMREALTRNAGMVAFPRFGARPIHSAPGGGYLVAFQSMLSRGDTARVHRDLVALGEQRKAAGVPPGVVSVDAAYLEASMLAQLRDSAHAAARLDDILENLAAQGDDLLAALHRPATLVSAMELRATLADRSGDLSTARRWRSAVMELRGTVSRQN